MGISHGTKCQLGMSAQIEPRTKKGDTENCVPSGFESAGWPLALVVQAVARPALTVRLESESESIDTFVDELLHSEAIPLH